MNPFITKTIPPTTVKTEKPTCSSYTAAYNVLFLQQTKQCVLILLALAALTTTCLESIQFTPPSWRTVIATLVLWLSQVIILVYRLISNTFERHLGPTLKVDLMAALTQRQNSIRILVYTIASIVLFFSSFLLVFRTTIPNNIVNGQRHGAQQINLERLYVIFYACLLGFSFSVHRNFTQRWVVQMQVVQQNPWYLIKYYLRSSIKLPLLWSLWLFLGSYVVYILFSSVIYTLATHFVGIFTTVLDSPIIGFRWWGVTLFIKMVLVGFSIVWNWMVMDMIVDVYYNKVNDCISSFANPIDCLIDGLQQKEKDRELRVYAFAELARLSSTDRLKRKAIYNDMENNDAPSNWARIRTECTAALDEYLNRINAEYKVNKKQDKTKDTQNGELDKASSKPNNNKKVVQLIDGNVMAKKRKNIAQLDDRTFHAVSHAVTQVSDQLPSPDIHVNSLMKDAWTMFRQSNIGKSITSTRPQGPLGQWLHYLCDETRNRKMYAVLGNPAIQLYSIQTLSNLVVYSLTEDDLGHVQYDLSPIINILLGCLSTINTYTVSPPPHYSKLSTVPDVPLLALYQLNLALADAILTIKFAFMDHLDDITIDDKYVSIWNEI